MQQYPKYSFKYGVNDQHTRDIKQQWEHRDGDLVKGLKNINFIWKRCM